MPSRPASDHSTTRVPADARALAAELSRRAAARPELREMAAPYLALLSAQAPAEDAFSPPALPEAEVRARLGRGVPALAPEDFRADPAALRQLWEEVCAVAARHFPDLAPALEPIRYLKVIDLRELVEEPLLPVERVLTLPMDLAARKEGYGNREE